MAGGSTVAVGAGRGTTAGVTARGGDLRADRPVMAPGTTVPTTVHHVRAADMTTVVTARGTAGLVGSTTARRGTTVGRSGGTTAVRRAAATATSGAAPTSGSSETIGRSSAGTTGDSGTTVAHETRGTRGPSETAVPARVVAGTDAIPGVTSEAIATVHDLVATDGTGTTGHVATGETHATVRGAPTRTGRADATARRTTVGGKTDGTVVGETRARPSVHRLREAVPSAARVTAAGRTGTDVAVRGVSTAARTTTGGTDVTVLRAVGATARTRDAVTTVTVRSAADVTVRGETGGTTVAATGRRHVATGVTGPGATGTRTTVRAVGEGLAGGTGSPRNDPGLKAPGGRSVRRDRTGPSVQPNQSCPRT